MKKWPRTKPALRRLAIDLLEEAMYATELAGEEDMQKRIASILRTIKKHAGSKEIENK